MQELQIQVEHITGHERIDKYIASQLPELSRSRLQQLITEGLVEINSKPIRKVSEKVKQGDEVHIKIPPPQPSTLQAENIDLSILWEDEYFAAINKQAGISVHPTETIRTGTLVNALLYHLNDLSGIGGLLRPGIVHRLDRGTSGVLIIAKQDEAHRKLSDLFKSRHVQKSYWALVHGVPTPPEGDISLAIGRHPSDRKRMVGRSDGRPSQTRYKIRRVGLGGSFVELYPLTGRTHQIRVHMNHIGCPVVGDRIYGTRKYGQRGEMERLLEEYPGFALHARAIRFNHPITDCPVLFEVEPPEVLNSMIEKMEIVNE